MTETDLTDAIKDPHQRCQHKLYRLSCTEYDALWERSGGACEMCRIPFDKTPGGVNIDHEPPRYTNVRGLLCTSCNTARLVAHEDEVRYSECAASYLANAWYRTRPSRTRPTGVPQRRVSAAPVVTADVLADRAADYLSAIQARSAAHATLIAEIRKVDPKAVSQADVIKRTKLSRETVRKMERAAGLDRRR